MAQVLGPVGVGSNNGEVVTLADGGYMAVWTHLVSSLFPIPGVTDVMATAVLGRVFNADGTPRGDVFQVNQSDANSGQGQPEIALLSNGNLAVVWTDGPSLVDFDVSARGRIITAAGAPVTDEFQLSSVTARDQRIPQVAANDSGGFFASWSDGRSPWSNTREQWIGQEFDATGARIGPELWLRDDSRSEDSELVSLGNGNYAVIATQGRITGTDVSFLYSNPLHSSTNTATYNMPGFTETFGFEDDAAGDGNGHVVTAQPNGGFGVTVRLLAPYDAPNVQAGGTFSDGTPFADTLMYLGDDPQSVSSGGVVNLGWLGFGVRPDGVTFNPSATHYPSVATTFMPNGNIAVVWTGVSGGTVTVPQFSVYAQIISAEGIILSDIAVIEDQNVQGSDIAPPFVSAGADGQLFIGWTGTTARNGAGTNEVMGGVFDVPTYDLTTITPSGAFATQGDDSVTGYPFAADDPSAHLLYLLDGNDTWYQGEGYGSVFGMGGDDRFIFSDTVAGGADVVPGLGRDTFDYSLWTAGRELPRPANLTSGNAAFSAEVVIGTMFNDTATTQGSTGDESLLLHTEAGDDTIQFYSGNGGITVDGGDGVDTMTTYNNRADWQLDFHGDHYTLGFINYGGTVYPERNIVVRAVESIVFADETVTLQATASLASGGAGSAGGIGGGTSPIIGTTGSDTLSGQTGDDVIEGREGDDSLLGGAGNDTLRGEAGNDHLYGGDGTDLARFGIASGSATVVAVAGGLQITSTEGVDFVASDVETIEFSDGILTYAAVAALEVVANTDINGTAGDDVLIGTSASEVINGFGGDDIIAPGIGSDTIDGGDGIDRLSFRAVPDTAGSLPAQMRLSVDLTVGVAHTSGADIYQLANIEKVFGSDFADQIIGNAGANQLNGFAGNDVISGLDGDDVVSGGGGDDVVAGGYGNDQVFGDDGNDTLYLGFGNDIGAGGAGNDIIYGGAGQNTIWGGLGDDTVQGGTGIDIIYGGSEGSNRLLGNDGADQIYAGSGGDYIDGGAGADLIRGGNGIDTIFGGAGDNNVGGGGGDDILRMADGNDTVYGGLGNDNIGGGAGNDLIIDGAGNNIIWGGAGADSVYGGTGNDTIYGGGNGANVLLGDAGNDLIHGGDGSDFIGGGTGNDEIYGGAGGDTIYAGTGNDFVGGGAGNDVIYGSAGDNRVYLGLGDDRFIAGTGKDVVTGRAGADVFVFQSVAQIGIGTARDVISDFISGEDRIDLSSLSTQFNGAGGLLAGGASSFFYYAAGGLLIGDADGNGAADWVLELSGAPAIAATDFML